MFTGSVLVDHLHTALLSDNSLGKSGGSDQRQWDWRGPAVSSDVQLPDLPVDAEEGSQTVCWVCVWIKCFLMFVAVIVVNNLLLERHNSCFCICSLDAVSLMLTVMTVNLLMAYDWSTFGMCPSTYGSDYCSSYKQCSLVRWTLSVCSGSTTSAQKTQIVIAVSFQSDTTRQDDSSGIQPTIESQVRSFCC